jgi:hypothetical protein
VSISWMIFPAWRACACGEGAFPRTKRYETLQGVEAFLKNWADESRKSARLRVDLSVQDDMTMTRAEEAVAASVDLPARGKGRDAADDGGLVIRRSDDGGDIV